MIGKVLTAWLISTVTVTFVLLLAGVPRAQGQICCGQVLNPITVKCKMQGCSGIITIPQCVTESYGIIYEYDMDYVYCCQAQASTAQELTGLICGEFVDAEPTQLAERVWVRDCHGRYALVTVPIRSYPA